MRTTPLVLVEELACVFALNTRDPLKSRISTWGLNSYWERTVKRRKILSTDIKETAGMYKFDLSIICDLYSCNCGPGSVVGIATGYGLGGPGIESRWGPRFFEPVQTGPGAHPASCTMGTGSFPGVKSGWGVTLTPHLLLVPWSRKGRTIPLLSPWAVRPVRSFSACTKVHFAFTAVIAINTVSYVPL